MGKSSWCPIPSIYKVKASFGKTLEAEIEIGIGAEVAKTNVVLSVFLAVVATFWTHNSFMLTVYSTPVSSWFSI